MVDYLISCEEELQIYPAETSDNPVHFQRLGYDSDEEREAQEMGESLDFQDAEYYLKGYIFKTELTRDGVKKAWAAPVENPAFRRVEFKIQDGCLDAGLGTVWVEGEGCHYL